MKDFSNIVSQFAVEGTIEAVKPLGNGLINDTFIVKTAEDSVPDYVLQRINHQIFTDVNTLQDNIMAVTAHIRRKLTEAGEKDIERKVLQFIPLKGDLAKTYFFDGESYWRMMVFIPRAHTLEAVNPETSRFAGKAFGNFQAMLVDIDKELKESIPDFHNMEFRLKQLHDAVKADPVGRVKEVKPLLDELESRAEEMCKAERLYREGKLPKRICHCDTKVNNMMFDEDGHVLCVIDLDTVMPSFIFSDYGDFLRTAANTLAEDDPNIADVEFNMDIFRAFTEGYLSSAKDFLSPIEIENLPYAAALFPYMQAVRFLTDYINGDTYYKIKYPDHNLVRTRNQFKLLQSIEAHTPEMKEFIKQKLEQF
ncbi:MAG: aminoglycoside phosphotransferase family protein [Muribaculaceae bacterium]|nr:aminoglycoside phosphotransferase family protein [Muribaculaceae bacterium]